MHKVRPNKQKSNQAPSTTEETASRSQGTTGQTGIEKPTREQVGQLAQEVAKKVTQNPEKAASLMSEWMLRPARRAKKRAA